MFSFMKKTSDKSSLSKQQTPKGSDTSNNDLTNDNRINNNSTNINTSVIHQVLVDYHIDAQPINSMISKLTQLGNSVTIDLRLPETENPEEIHRELSQRLHLHGVKEVNLNVSLPAKTADTIKGASKRLPKTIDAIAASQASQAESNQSIKQPIEEPPIAKKAPTQASLQPHPRIKHILVVASGKGGVGKSTTTVNIALALQKLGNRVGILDADIYGPSIPTMLGVTGVKPALENEQFVPIEAHGLAMLSIGSLLDGDNTPVAWRGPKATGALMQLFNQTNWPMLDYLVIDMPPGTGDIQLTLAQRIPVTGAIIVTTPQHVALMDAQKGIEMFNKTNIPVIGVVENMALYTCSNCGHTEAIFGTGGGQTIAKEYQVPLLGQLPLASDIRAQADKGTPSVIAKGGDGDDYANFYINIAKNVAENIAKFTKERNDGRIF